MIESFAASLNCALTRLTVVPGWARAAWFMPQYPEALWRQLRLLLWTEGAFSWIPTPGWGRS